jgi:hypothetical protein
VKSRDGLKEFGTIMVIMKDKKIQRMRITIIPFTSSIPQTHKKEML